MQEATSGEALIEGSRTFVGDRDIYHRIGYMPDVGEAFDDCTVENLLRFFGRCHGMTEKVIQERITALLKRFHLEELRNSVLENLSKGEKQQAHIMRTLIHSPKVLILDEPASNLDPLRRMLLLDILREEKEKGTTILISSHILPELENLCTSVAILNGGLVAASGRIEELLDAHQSFLKSYRVRFTGGIAEALRVLKDWGDAVKKVEEFPPDQIRFQLNGAPEDVSALLQLTIRQGARICEFELERKNIEQIYVDIVRN